MLRIALLFPIRKTPSKSETEVTEES